MAIDFMSAGGAVLPDGGKPGQVLAKKSNESFDTEWINAPSGGGSTLYTYVWAATGSLTSPFAAQTITLSLPANKKIISSLTLCYVDSDDFGESSIGRVYTFIIPYAQLGNVFYQLKSDIGYRNLRFDSQNNQISFVNGYNMLDKKTDNYVCLPYRIYATLA